MEVTGDRSLRAGDARLRCLADAIEHLQAAGSRDRVTDILRRAAHRLCDADGVCVVRRGGEQCHYVEEGDVGPVPRGQHLPLLSRVADLAMRQRRTVVVADAHGDPRIPRDDLGPAFVRSLVAVPVGGEAPEASIGVCWSRIHMPDREEVSALEALARSAAGAFRAIDLLSSLTSAKERAEELHEQARRDLAERERVEAALRAARDEAERARAVAEEADRAKSRFLAAAGHDLRQPVMAAGLYVDQLARRLKDRDARMLADMVRASLDGLRGLLNGLLETARLEAGAVRPEVTAFALDDLLQRLSVEFEAQALASRLWFQVPHTLAVVRTDCLLLELMLRNLIANALKYTRRGGVTVEAVEEGGSVRIEVRDTGIGIPPDQLGRIFEDFYQVGDASASPPCGVRSPCSGTRWRCAPNRGAAPPSSSGCPSFPSPRRGPGPLGRRPGPSGWRGTPSWSPRTIR
jgi:signal transduction histidine kinase